MRYTLLELTQDILSSMDSDEINSINDSVESLQVVKILKTVYDDIISRGDLTSNRFPFNLTASGDTAKPVLMTKPDNIDKVLWVKYNCIKSGDTDPVWNEIRPLSVVDYFDYIHQYNPTETNVDTMTIVSNGFVFTFNYRNDTAPRYYCSFDDNNIIFDAYDSAVDNTLQSVKTLCYGSLKTDWQETDTFIPNLQPQQFALLLNEAKSLAWAELKQTAHQKAEQSARRNWRHLQKTRTEIPAGKYITDTNHPFHTFNNFARPV